MELGKGAMAVRGEWSRGREEIMHRAVRGRGRKGALEKCTGREGVARLHRPQQLDGKIV